MSPAAEPADLTAEAEAALPAELLADGEVILLAVKPSRWFVALVSWPVLLLAAVAVAVAHLANTAFGATMDVETIALACLAVAGARLAVAAFQWAGRLYVLTDRRVIRLRGLLRADLGDRHLRDIQAVHRAATQPERLLGVGSLLFECSDAAPLGEAHWTHLADPESVARAIEEARAKAR